MNGPEAVELLSVKSLNQLDRKNVIMTGIETHICIIQTALHLLPRFGVHVISDAVSSRSLENWRIALQRMRQSGVIVSSTEMVIYELLERAGTEEFRKTLPLVK
jgi:isochorismate hydrolase